MPESSTNVRFQSRCCLVGPGSTCYRPRALGDKDILKPRSSQWTHPTNADVMNCNHVFYDNTQALGLFLQLLHSERRLR
jgi:hypothetical protein